MSLPPGPDYTPSTYLKDTKSTNVYVETGMFRGDSLQYALEVGFDTIIGIDNDPWSIGFCNDRFKDNRRRFQLHQGDSSVMLWDVIKDIKEPITFFLDSHWQMLEGTDPGPSPFPLLQELKQIARHPLCIEHKVIIDDWHIFYHDRVGYTKADILEALDKMGLKRQSLIANPVINGICVAEKW